MQVFAFSKVAATKDFKGFPMPSHSLPSNIRRVQLFLSTIWPHPIGVINPEVVIEMPLWNLNTEEPAQSKHNSTSAAKIRDPWSY
jgi:hypothetical protein